MCRNQRRRLCVVRARRHAHARVRSGRGGTRKVLGGGAVELVEVVWVICTLTLAATLAQTDENYNGKDESDEDRDANTNANTNLVFVCCRET